MLMMNSNAIGLRPERSLTSITRHRLPCSTLDGVALHAIKFKNSIGGKADMRMFRLWGAVAPFLVVLSAGLAGRPALAVEAFEGRWAEERAWCARPDGASDETAIRLSSRELAFFASNCTIARIVRRPPKVLIDAQCRNEGEEASANVSKRFFLFVTGDRLSLSEKTLGAQTYVRCP